MKTIKRIVMYILIFFPVSGGFSVSRAKRWTRKVYRDIRENKKHTFRQKVKAYRRGYMPDVAERFGITGENQNDFISEKDYFYLQPINGIYRKWLANKPTVRKVFSPFKDNLQELYYQISTKNEKLAAYPLEDCPDKSLGKKGLLSLVREKQKVVVTAPNRNRNVLLSYKDGRYTFGDHETADETDLFDKIIEFSPRAIIAEYIDTAEGYGNDDYEQGTTVRIIIANDKGNLPLMCEASLRIDIPQAEMDSAADEDGGDDSDDEDADNRDEVIFHIDIESGRIGEGNIRSGRVIEKLEDGSEFGMKTGTVIPNWEAIREAAIEMGMHVPQLAFFAVDMVITEGGFKCIRFVNVPKYQIEQPFRKETVEFLRKKLHEKKELYSRFGMRVKRGAKRIKLKTRKCFAMLFFPAGLKPYLSVRWIKEVTIDLFTNRDVKLSTKIWAYRHGFLSYRIPQYGITKENHLDYISDFEYKWLRHINGRYRVLFEDKITIKYIVSDFKECFPEYYYHIKTDNDGNVIIPMMDCPNKYGRDFEDIFTLAEEKGVLALKPDEGSHGDGFYKLAYEDGQYYLNFDKVEKEDVLAILKNPENQYLVTEYINNHPQFKEIYDGAVNTIRMIVYKMDGKTPEIGNAYMRFGSKATGAVDNMGAGGMFVQVDIDTGRYGNAKIITHNSIQDCPYHPDSGVLIEGTIPHWEQIKQTILDIAESIQQMEYFGFDIAVTEDGIKFPEINRFPDYPKIEQLSPATMKYLLHKLEQKKHLYGYDVKPCRKLVHLPRR